MIKPASTPDKHQYKIAVDTIKNPAKAFLGGMSVDDAIKILKTKFKYTDAEIRKLQEHQVTSTQKLQESAIRKIERVVRRRINEGSEINQQLHDVLLKYEKDGLIDTIEYGFDFGEVLNALTGKDKRDFAAFVNSIKYIQSGISAMERIKSRYDSWV